MFSIVKKFWLATLHVRYSEPELYIANRKAFCLPLLFERAFPLSPNKTHLSGKRKKKEREREARVPLQTRKVRF